MIKTTSLLNMTNATSGHKIIFPFEDFVAYLQQNGYTIGINSYLRLQELVNHLGANSSAEQLKTILCPIFATNPEEQEKFFFLFDSYFAQFQTLDASQFPNKDSSLGFNVGNSNKIKRIRLPQKWWLITAGIIGVLCLMSFGVFLLYGFNHYQEANDYFSTYSFKPKFWQRHTYTFRSLLNMPQPCDSLEADLFYEITKEGGKNTIELRQKAKGNPIHFVWTLDGKNIGTVPSFKYAFPNTGSHTIGLEVENDYGCKRVVTSEVDLSPAVPQKVLTAKYVYAASEKTVSFKDSSLVGEKYIISWLWNFGDGKTSKENNPKHIYKQYGSYKVCLTVNDGIKNHDYCEQVVVNQTKPKEYINSTDLPVLPSFSPIVLGEVPKDVKRRIKNWKYLPLLLGIVLAVVLPFLWLLYRRLRRRYAIQKVPNISPPYYWPINIETPTNFYDKVLWNKVTTTLRKREEGEKNILDVPASVVATMAAGGYPTLQYRAGRQPVEYLFLIDKVSHKDHQAKYFQLLAERLAKEDIYIDVYFHNHHFQYFWRTFDERPIYLEEVIAQHSKHRLVILGDGDGLVDAYTGEVADSAEALFVFKYRALMSSVSTSNWGIREATIERNFNVLPAKLAAFAVLAERFERRGNAKMSDWMTGVDNPLPDFTLEVELDDVEAYLGPDLFRWFMACAVYPELHWELTLHLGKFLSETYYPEQNKSGDYYLLKEERLLRLIRLPYFRKGEIPEKMRMELVGRMDEKMSAQVRKAIVAVLEKNLPPEGSAVSDKYKMNIVLQKYQMNKQDEESRTTVEGMLERNEVQDAVVLETLKKEGADSKMIKNTVLAKDTVRDALFRGGIPLLGLKTGVVITISIILAAIGIAALIWWLPSEKQLYQDKDKKYYYLENKTDSVEFLGYKGIWAFHEKIYGSAINRFSLALGLDVTNPKLYYNRGLSYLCLYQSQPEQPDSTLLQSALHDFQVADFLMPTFTAETKLAEVKGYDIGKPAISKLAPMGNRVVFAKGKEITVGDLKLSTTVTKSFVYPANIIDIGFSPDGTQIVSINSDYTINIMAVADMADRIIRNKLDTRTEHKGNLTAMAYTPSLAIVATGGADKNVVLWDVFEGNRITKFSEHRGIITDLNFSADGEYLISASKDSSAIIWERATQRPIQFLSGHESPLVAAEFTPNALFSITVTEGGMVRIWEQNGLFYRFQSHLNEVSKATLSPDGSMILLAGKNGILGIYDWGGNEITSINLIEQLNRSVKGGEANIETSNFSVSGLSFANNDEKICVSTNKGTLILSFDNTTFLLPKNKTNPISRKLEGYNGLMLSNAADGNIEKGFLRKYAIPYQLGLSYLANGQYEQAYNQFFSLPIPFVSNDSLSHRYLLARGVSGILWAGVSQNPAIYSSALEDINNTYRYNKRLFGQENDFKIVKNIDKINADVWSNEYISQEEITLNLRAKSCLVQDNIYNNYCSIKNKYDEVGVPSEGYRAFRKGNLWGFLDKNNKEVVKEKYTEVQPIKNGLAIVTGMNGGKIPQTFIINVYGTTVYDQIGVWGEDMMAVRKNGLWGYIDRNLKEKITPQFEEAGLFKYDMAIVKKGNKYGYLNKESGKVVSGYKYDAAKLYNDDGLAEVMVDYNTFFIDKKGNMQKITAVGGDDAKPKSIVSIRDPEVKKEMAPQNAQKQYDFLGDLNDGLRLVRSNGLYGYINAKGDRITDIIYQEAMDFSEARAAVKLQDTWGFLDRNGLMVIPLKYEQVKISFKNGAAFVKQNGQFFYINPDGNCVDKPGYSCPQSNMQQQSQSQKGGAISLPANMQETANEEAIFEKAGKWGLKDVNGKEIIPAKFENRPHFVAGVAKVKQNGKWSFIRKDGKALKITTPYDEVGNFSFGLAPVKRNGKWGYIDLKGDEVIPLIYDQASEYVNRRATVVKDGKTIIINLQGGTVEVQSAKGGKLYY